MDQAYVLVTFLPAVMKATEGRTGLSWLTVQGCLLSVVVEDPVGGNLRWLVTRHLSSEAESDGLCPDDFLLSNSSDPSPWMVPAAFSVGLSTSTHPVNVSLAQPGVCPGDPDPVKLVAIISLAS